MPYDVRLIVEKALEKDPADRYQTMRDMVVDLRRAQRAASSTTAAIPVPAPARRGRSRLLPLAIIVGTAGLAAVALSVWYLPRADLFWKSSLADAQYARLTDFEGSELDASVSPDGKFVAFLSDHDGQFDVWVSQIGSGNPINLTHGRRAQFSSPQVRTVGFWGDGTRLWMWAGGVDDSGRIVPGIESVPIMGGTLQPFVNTAINVTWSPDRRQIVYHESTAGDPMVVADPNGSNPRRMYVAQPGIHNHYPVWSPDGFIYFVRGIAPDEMDVWRIRPTGGEPERLTHHDSHVAYLAMLDRRRLLYTATAEDGSGPWLYEVDTERYVTHRVSAGLEQYLSVAASADGTRIVAAVANPTTDLCTVPIADRPLSDADVSKVALPTPRALSPRVGPDYLMYLSSKGAGDGIWKFKDGAATELWKTNAGFAAGAPAASPDGRQIAFAYRRQGRTRLYLMNDDGTDVREVTSAPDIRGSLSWSPDGKWIAIAAIENDGSRLFKVPIDGGPPVRLTDGLAINPVWSPDGRLIVYSMPISSASFPVRAITPEGGALPLPEIFALVGGDRYRFLPDGSGLVVMRGGWRQQDFWLLDFATGKTRRLTQFKGGYTTTSFDVSRDGKQILFDRIRDNADIVLITLPSGS